ncbi:thiamine pyrophosphate-dependent dehydrogenase E1 component subunit alpha [Aquibacillus koreensis]|uniref:2-oxoisovalerate dehydrogenase subunit alpha n=1 Tax=Aquibacillus koreensis TaxID=279446 RepID=A0A9X4AGR3_9BACI|nr:thiamine pyrophosphate-dependent dehydrogenase E1 component subunit alpha [Aquibacillus koreensis]MCT2537498.1 thiamine pyrophosphate-dependent dehydrogenase E1 component subunit alpha [Aquibacillus koreensis]MDC3418944.1 thiamine pyrophosphate-dependent dehydrogenase E1 component subunit alpha [Aquibacillus koreensis]
MVKVDRKKKVIEQRHEQLGLNDEQVLDMYRNMLLARRIDERMYLLNRAGKIPFVVSCQGQEPGQVGAAFALDKEKDYALPYYRDLGVVLTFGMTTKDLFLQAFAKAEDPNSGGRQMPGHFGQKKNRIVTGSSPVTTQVPHAVGIALGAKMEKKDFVSFVTFGEGSSNQGDFHEGANFAAVHKLPVIFMVENNQYAISVPLSKQVACEKISDRAIGYGMPGITVDGNDPLAVYEAVKDAVTNARNGHGPTLIEVVSYRLLAHSSDDDDRSYRSKEEVDEAKEKDGIITFATYLRETNVLTEEIEVKLNDEIKSLIDDATDYAEKAPYADAKSIYKHVYAE